MAYNPQSSQMENANLKSIDPEKERINLERKKQAQQSFISQILDQDAQARLGRISAVKPERATAIANLLISMVQRGQIVGRVDESTFVKILSQVVDSEESKKPKVTIQRRRDFDDFSD
ncbi:programmed cell death protein 5-like [Zophobas morio]|uniref:programmed cell death protein 5-like n=1 Tax=Zophobas morio TaxID=2755281 RepID=UPI003082E143